MVFIPGASKISPKLQKGSIIAVDTATNKILNTIPFQYNPESLTRTLQVQGAGGENAAREEALRLEGAPIETFKVDIEFDATDQLEKLEAASDTVVEFGIYPQLSALETLIYPKSKTVKDNMKRAKDGMIEIIPMQAPMTLLYWGKH